MTDWHAYRASDDLAEALRAFRTERTAFSERVIAFDTANPGHELLWRHVGFGPQDDQRACGFRDGADAVPDGLSRAKTRVGLRPKKTKAGKPWQDVLDRMNRDRPMVEPVFKRFGVPSSVDGGPGDSFGSFRIGPVQWGDAGVDGVLVYAMASLSRPAMGRGEDEPLSEHVTPIPLSEFYAIKERLDAEHEARGAA